MEFCRNRNYKELNGDVRNQKTIKDEEIISKEWTVDSAKQRESQVNLQSNRKNKIKTQKTRREGNPKAPTSWQKIANGLT